MLTIARRAGSMQPTSARLTPAGHLRAGMWRPTSSLRSRRDRALRTGRGDLLRRYVQAVDAATVKQRIPPALRGRVLDLYGLVRKDFYPYDCWSQGGEDMVLRDLLPRTRTGFFVDVGAFHPRFGSNTYALYKRGWRGINVDARPGAMAAFRRSRPHDRNLEVAVGSEPGEADFYVFFDGELCSLEKEWADRQVELGHRLEKVVPTQVLTLAQLHEENQVPPVYDLLNVDCEGRDEDVLASHDWSRWRPRHVVTEWSEGGQRDLADALTCGPVDLLRSVGYRPVAATRLSAVLVDTRS